MPTGQVERRRAANMPRTALPPTPASSTDIQGQDGSKQLAALQMAFELPPPAITPNGSRPNTSETKASPAGGETSPYSQTSPKTPYPVQASETVKSRRRSSAAQGPAKDAFALPPPPTRSRKIIQMKPRPQESATAETTTGGRNTANTKAAVAPAPTNTSTAAGGKKKQPSATSAAGRKIARKTAHSLIERRRRSKMNEEFAVLKGMIPACTGEMHKLAILQASIEYVRYLEDCVAKLKAQRESEVPTTPTELSGMPTPSGREFNHEFHFTAPLEPHSPDIEMTGSEAPSPTFTANPARSHQPSISPALLAEDSRHRRESYSSNSTDQRHYSYSASATTSPNFGPQPYGYHGSNSASNSILTSPALPPQRDLDQEATAALLMLNSDRRGTNASSAGRGMSVRDLLST